MSVVLTPINHKNEVVDFRSVICALWIIVIIYHLNKNKVLHHRFILNDCSTKVQMWISYYSLTASAHRCYFKVSFLRFLRFYDILLMFSLPFHASVMQNFNFNNKLQTLLKSAGLVIAIGFLSLFWRQNSPTSCQSKTDRIKYGIYELYV